MSSRQRWRHYDRREQQRGDCVALQQRHWRVRLRRFGGRRAADSVPATRRQRSGIGKSGQYVFPQRRCPDARCRAWRSPTPICAWRLPERQWLVYLTYDVFSCNQLPACNKEEITHLHRRCSDCWFLVYAADCLICCLVEAFGGRPRSLVQMVVSRQGV